MHVYVLTGTRVCVFALVCMLVWVYVHEKCMFSCICVATAEFSKFAGILSAALSQHHLVPIMQL